MFKLIQRCLISNSLQIVCVSLVLFHMFSGKSCESWTEASNCPTLHKGLLFAPKMTTKICQAFASCSISANKAISGEALASLLTTTESLKQAKVSSGKSKAKNYLDPEPSGQPKGSRFLLIMKKPMFMSVTDSVLCAPFKSFGKLYDDL